MSYYLRDTVALIEGAVGGIGAASAQAAVRGLTTRRLRIIVPKRWAPISMMRGVFNALSVRYLAGDRAVSDIVRKLEQGGP